VGRGKKAILGILTFAQVPLIAVLALTDLEVPGVFIFTLVLVQFGLWFFYLWDIRQNSRVPQDKERIWWWTIFTFGPLVEPIYFWRFIRGDELAW